jgi:prepilin-type N-terminal cleavage/methylation domain-containing protein
MRRRKGFTLTEIAIVLGIIGIILGAVWTAASGVYASANSTEVANRLGIYIAAVRTACTSGCSSLPPLPQSPPSVAGASVTASINSASTHILIDFTNLPTTNAGLAFCNGVASSVRTIGGVVGVSSSAADTLLSGGTAATCTGSTIKCPTYSAYTSNLALNGATCAANTITGLPTCSYVATNLCTIGVTTMGASFGQSF